MARRPPADRGRVGVRGARPESAVYPWGDTFDTDLANVVNSTGPKPVGSYPTGAAGSARWTWPATRWSGSRTGSTPATTRRARPRTRPARRRGKVKVEKGGWWGSNEFVARSAYRHYEDPPTYGDKHIGFRIASQ